MDAGGLRKLEQLAGLDLEVAERRQLVLDLAVLTDFCAQLPEPGDEESVPVRPIRPGKDQERPPCVMDRSVAVGNVPLWQDGRCMAPSPIPSRQDS